MSCKQSPICSPLRPPPTESSPSEQKLPNFILKANLYLIQVEYECKEFALGVVAGEVGSVEQGGRVERGHDGREDRVRHREEDHQEQSCKISNLEYIEKILKSAFLLGFTLFSVPVRDLLKAYLVLMIMLNFFLIFKNVFQIKTEYLKALVASPQTEHYYAQYYLFQQL